jgi:hypothetical protein
MGIAELEPHQLAPTVGTTGSGTTGSPALSSSLTTTTQIASGQLVFFGAINFINNGHRHALLHRDARSFSASKEVSKYSSEQYLQFVEIADRLNLQIELWRRCSGRRDAPLHAPPVFGGSTLSTDRFANNFGRRRGSPRPAGSSGDSLPD